MDSSISPGLPAAFHHRLGRRQAAILNEDGSESAHLQREIYNFQEIKKDLLAAGHVFKTATDSRYCSTATRNTAKLLNKLRGMFAFVIWDKEKRGCLAPGTFRHQAPVLRPDGRHLDVWLGDQKLFAPSPLPKS